MSIRKPTLYDGYLDNRPCQPCSLPPIELQDEPVQSPPPETRIDDRVQGNRADGEGAERGGAHGIRHREEAGQEADRAGGDGLLHGGVHNGVRGRDGGGGAHLDGAPGDHQQESGIRAILTVVRALPLRGHQEQGGQVRVQHAAQRPQAQRPVRVEPGGAPGQDGSQMIYLPKVIMFDALFRRMLLSSDCVGFTNNITASTNSSVASARSFYSGIALSQASMEKIVVESNTDAIYSLMLNGAIPFIIAGVVFFGATVTLIACCLFQKSCPPCESWRRNFTLRPYTKTEMGLTTYVLLIFLVATLSTSIFSLTTIQGFQSAVTGTKCSIQESVQLAVNGNSGSWGGFQNMIYQLGNISSALTTANSRISSSLGADNEWLITSMDSVQRKVYDLYGVYSTEQLDSPNPDSGTRVDPITSQFIANMLGPITKDGTMTYGLDKWLNNTKRMTDRGYLIDQNARAMQANTPSIQTNFNFSINLLNQFVTQLDIFQTNVNSFTNTVFEKYFVYGIYALQAVVGLVMAASFLGLTGGIATYCVGIHNCRMIVHLAWISLMVLFYFVLIFTYIAIPGGAVLDGVCTYYNTTLHNQTEFKKYSAFASETVIDKASACLFQKGEILPTFEVDKQINSIFYLFTNITDFVNMQNTAQNVYVGLTLVNTEITQWETELTNRMQGVWSDATTDTSFNNPIKALEQLSILTDLNTNPMPKQGCPSYRDEWRFSLSNCTNTRQVSGITTDSAFVADGSPVCISMGYDDSRPSVVKISSRYKSMQAEQTTQPVGVNYASCKAIYAQIMKYATNIVEYRDSRIELFRALLNDVSDIKTSYNNLKSNLDSYITNVNLFKSNVATLDTLIQDQLTGIVYTTNCTPVATSLFKVQDQMCVSFEANIFKLAIGFIILVITMIGAVISGHIFAVRYSRVDLMEQIYPIQDEFQGVDDQKSELSAFD